ncbi:tetratricopeptide repeat protein [Thermosulfuriphilus sp.]
MIRKSIFYGLVVLFALVVFQWGQTSFAFPFRSVEIGDPLPPITVVDFESGEKILLTKLRGHPLVLVFWGADVPRKKKLTIKFFRDLQANLHFFEDRGVVIMAINVQGDKPKVIREVMEAAHLNVPIYLDSLQQAYSRLGLFVTPSVLIVDKDGRIAAGMGYSREFVKRIQGEILVLTGEKTREQVLAEFYPKTLKKSDREKKASLHYRLGLKMHRRGMKSAAIKEFQETIRFNPYFAPAYAQLGCLYLELGRLKEAEGLIKKSLELDPNVVQAKICQALLKAAQGHREAALEDLNILLLSNRRNPEIHYWMGVLYQEKGQIDLATKYFRKAYELLQETVGEGT